MNLLRNPHIRHLLWFVSGLSPLLAAVLALLIVPRLTRRRALYIFAIAIAIGWLAMIWFHFSYVQPIWANHSFAIHSLDFAAFGAGFASAVIAGLFLIACQALTRRTR